MIWSKEFNLSFAEIDEMDFEFLLDAAALKKKIDYASVPENRVYNIDEILPV